MSRCFPFPPPGYERKDKPLDLDALKKEKQREKKHKKEKREKKKEGKEKKARDRGDEKHRDKKERQERHRDKKKDKEDGDVDKNKIYIPVNDKRNLGCSEGCSSEMPNICSNDGKVNIGNASDEKKTAAIPALCNGGKLLKKSYRPPEPKDFKYVQGSGSSTTNNERWESNILVTEQKGSNQVKHLGSRSAVDERRTRNYFLEKHLPLDQKKDAGTCRLVEISPGSLSDGTRKTKEKTKTWPVNGSNDGPETDNVLAHNKVEKNINREMERKEKVQENELWDRSGYKQKEKPREKTSQRNKNREREKKKEEKVKLKSVHQYLEQSKNKNSLLDLEKIGVSDGNMCGNPDNTRHQNLQTESNMTAAASENIRKRKDLAPNGFLNEDGGRPNKLAKNISTSHMLMQSGQSLEPLQPSVKTTHDIQLVPIHIKSVTDEQQVPKDSKVSHCLQSTPKDVEVALGVQRTSKDVKAVLNVQRTPKDVKVAPDVQRRPNDVNIAPDLQQILKGLKVDPDVSPNSNDFNVASAVQLMTKDRELVLDDKPKPNCFEVAPVVPLNIKAQGKARKVNGGINAQSPSKPDAVAQADKKSEAPPKPPHPDTKYLFQVLAVPKGDAWSSFDDQEWLFTCSHSDSRKAKTETSRPDNTSHVWAEALRIESADVYALPYVIPL